MMFFYIFVARYIISRLAFHVQPNHPPMNATVYSIIVFYMDRRLQSFGARPEASVLLVTALMMLGRALRQDVARRTSALRMAD